MMLILRLIVFVLGAWIAYAAIINAIRSFVMPRNHNAWLARYVFIGVRRMLALLLMRRLKDKNEQWSRFMELDRTLAYHSPVVLIAMPIAILTLLLFGFMGMFWAIDAHTLNLTTEEGRNLALDDLYIAFSRSGSSLLTLGFIPAEHLGDMTLGFIEAMLGLIVVALIIAYLPTMYSEFTRREAFVAKLEVRAGSPPSPLEFVQRVTLYMTPERLDTLWVDWEDWFTELEETHTSLAALNFFRSPKPEHNWINAAGVILDSAALFLTTIDYPVTGQAQLTIRSGYLALRSIADFFRIEYDPDPSPDDPISISREQFDEAVSRLIASGVPVTADIDQAWRDFRGWRVNYDTVLCELALFLSAPPGVLWITDNTKWP